MRVIYVELKEKIDKDFRDTIRKVTGEYQFGDRSRVVRELIDEYIIKNKVI